MNITEDKLKAGIQIALGTLGLYTEEAETLLIHHIKALTIPDVVASVLCVNSKSYGYLTEGVEYKIITESKSFIEVLDDEGDNCYYDKDCFKKL
jgi:hypothetical protein